MSVGIAEVTPKEVAKTLGWKPGSKSVGWPRSAGPGKKAFSSPTGTVTVAAWGLRYPKKAVIVLVLASYRTQSRIGSSGP